MKLYKKYRNKTLIDYILGWTFAFIFLSIVRGIGTEELGVLKFDFTSSLIISSTLGPIIGFISGLVQLILEAKIYKKVSIQKFLLIRFFCAIIFLIFLIVAAYGTYQVYFGTEQDIISFAFDTGSFVIYFYVLFVDYVLNLLRQVNLMLGYGNLSKYLQERFYKPIEEERVFMFLDLQSSTQLAEQLGNLKYSALIQDCFNDLSVVIEQETDIYQYVGDEAVLTWKLATGIKKLNCIQAFYSFKQQINDRSNHYKKKYGTIPLFKAGVHYGKVTVAEVGKYKKEIAYHGDPVNTAARIQGKCNSLDATLLISKELKSMLDAEYSRQNNLALVYKSMGIVPLKGKKTAVEIFAVEKKDHASIATTN